MTDRLRPAQAETPRPYRVRLPGFIRDDDVGLGDLIKQVTTAAGVRPCGGCAKRAETLNQWFTVAGRRAP